ncbi:uroporphyrinogen-III synthase [Candidatus Williamhamiltonella defendens]|uniref:uroporphyrinogen-III synthase n=1 Tax=Candidatus Williamhamiltonella defendens TaxID=138072 RepID=UPI001E3FD3AB|nr:uroporphyrinogen-III synthase [Candidatus Hamiltonella defensa]
MVVLVTGPSPMGEELVRFIQAHGHTVYHCPLIEFSQGRDLMELSQRITQMREEDMIFVLSKTAIDYLASFFKNNPLSWPPSIFYHAIGRNTAQAWQKINPFKIIRYPLNQETREGLLALPNLQFINKKTALILIGRLLYETRKNSGNKKR